jgi:hypothetical protein
LLAVAILVSLAVLIIFTLCVPIELALHFDTDRKPKFSIRIRWLFGIVNKDLRKTEQKDIRGKTRTSFQVLRTRGLLRRFSRLLRDTIRRIKIRELRANLKIALDNPADTGVIFAFVAPVNYILSSYTPYEISIQPSFNDDAILEGYLHGTARLQPIRLVPPLLGFACSPPVMRAIKTLVSARWRRNR